MAVDFGGSPAGKTLDTFVIRYVFRGDERSVRRLQGSLKGVQTGIRKTSRVAAAAGAVITGAFAGALKAAVSEQTEFATIATRTGLTLAEVEKTYGESVRQIAMDTGLATKSISDALQKSISAGVDGADAITAVGQAAKFEQANLGTASDLISTATSLVQIYGAENLSLAQAMDQVTRASQIGEGATEDYSAAIKSAAQVAGQLGISSADLNATIAMLSQVAPSVSEAGTQLQSFLTTFFKPSNQAKKALAELAEETGKALDIDSIQARLQAGEFKDVIADLVMALEGDMSRLGKILGRVEGIRAFGELDPAKMRAFSAEIEAAGGTIDRAFGESAKTAKVQLDRVIQSLGVMAGEIGEALIPTFEAATGKIKEMIDWFRNLDAGTKEMIGKALLLGPALLALVPILQGVAAAIGIVNAAMALNPAVLIAAGIAAAIVGLVVLFRNWDAVVGAMGRGARKLKKWLTDALYIALPSWAEKLLGLEGEGKSPEVRRREIEQLEAQQASEIEARDTDTTVWDPTGEKERRRQRIMERAAKIRELKAALPAQAEAYAARQLDQAANPEGAPLAAPVGPDPDLMSAMVRLSAPESSPSHLLAGAPGAAPTTVINTTNEVSQINHGIGTDEAMDRFQVLVQAELAQSAEDLRSAAPSQIAR